MDVGHLSAILTSLLITKVTEDVASKIGSDTFSLLLSLRGKIRKELEDDERTSLALNHIEKNGSENLRGCLKSNEVSNSMPSA